MIRRTKRGISLKKTSKKRVRTLNATKAKSSSKDVKNVSYKDYLIDSLKDPVEAAGYLDAALSGGDSGVFLLALQNVVQAQGGPTRLAEKTIKSRPGLYKSLSDKGNPYLKSASDILIAMGMRFAVIPNKKQPSARKNLNR